MIDSFINAKQKAQAYQSLFSGSDVSSRPSSSASKYLDGSRGLVDPTPLQGNIRLPASDSSTDAIQARTGSQLSSLMNTGLSTATQQFGALTGLNNQAIDTATSLSNQAAINEEQLKRTKAGQPSSLSTALGYVNQGLSVAGSAASAFGSFGASQPPAPQPTFFSSSSPLTYSSDFTYYR